MKATIKMDYEEYQNLLDLIKEQENCINEFRKQPNVVLVDSRYGYSIGSHHVPRVTGDEEKAKQMMKSEFDNLLIRYDGLESQYNELKKKNNNTKKSFWSK
jgi:hypothetical protein